MLPDSTSATPEELVRALSLVGRQREPLSEDDARNVLAQLSHSDSEVRREAVIVIRNRSLSVEAMGRLLELFEEKENDSFVLTALASAAGVILSRATGSLQSRALHALIASVTNEELAAEVRIDAYGALDEALRPQGLLRRIRQPGAQGRYAGEDFRNLEVDWKWLESLAPDLRDRIRTAAARQ